MTVTCNNTLPEGEPVTARVRMGLDLVQISRIVDSTAFFGERFKSRLFTRQELDYAESGYGGVSDGGQCAERLAARFAAKEATIKALNLAEAGINWKDIEVRKLGDGECALALHGAVAEIAKKMGLAGVSLSMSHDGDYAGAVVAMTFEPPDPLFFEQRFAHVQ